MSNYVTDTLELLGDKDPLAVLAETPSWLAARVEGLSTAALTKPEADGKWSMTQVMAHLTDTEIAYGWRARIMLTQHHPPLHGFDENAWSDSTAPGPTPPKRSVPSPRCVTGTCASGIARPTRT